MTDYIKFSITKPFVIETEIKTGVKNYTINFDIEPVEGDRYKYYSVTLGLGVWSYDAIVAAIIHAKYTSDEIEAINSNITKVLFDSDSVDPDKIEEYKSEAKEFQAWREHAKELARNYIAQIPVNEEPPL
jgi:hypothetical protein